MLYKTITENTQVTTQDCWLMGAEMSHTGNTDMKVYNVVAGAAVAANLVSTPRTTAYSRHACIVFPYPGIKCNGIWADWTAGVGTIYYRH